MYIDCCIQDVNIVNYKQHEKQKGINSSCKTLGNYTIFKFTRTLQYKIQWPEDLNYLLFLKHLLDKV